MSKESTLDRFLAALEALGETPPEVLAPVSDSDMAAAREMLTNPNATLEQRSFAIAVALAGDVENV